MLVVAELLVPIIAERAPGGPTTWHPHHIAERYGLFTIIVLGEAVAAATIAVRTGLDEGEHLGELLSLAAAGLVIVFALWWLYFDRSAHGLLTTLRTSIAVGLRPLLHLRVGGGGRRRPGRGGRLRHPPRGDLRRPWPGTQWPCPWRSICSSSGCCTSARTRRGPLVIAYPVVAVLTLLTPLGPAPVHVIAVLMVVLVAITITVGRRVPDRLG